MKNFIFAILATVMLLFTTGCKALSDIAGINYASEAEFKEAVDDRVDKRGLDPALALQIKGGLYDLWQGDRETVLDSYELDEATKTLIINKLTE